MKRGFRSERFGVAIDSILGSGVGVLREGCNEVQRQESPTTPVVKFR